MVLRKCPKCKEKVNAESVACPRCGVIFREYKIKRALVWGSLLAICGWAFHGQLSRHFAQSGNATHALRR
jgi:hypothetical protein